MRETDRTSIHEAMEQQTISMAKAGIVCKLNTRCAIIAAANPRNLYHMSEPEGTSTVNIGIASPLLSRFDLVFILRDERVPEWDAIIAEHLLSQARADFAGFSLDSETDIWSSDKLQSHFASICHIKPKMSKQASNVIAKYFQRCREDPLRDFARTTVRLLDSMNRLAEAYARLMFRNEVTVLDAFYAIRLMESTHGFGRIIKPFDVVKQELPFDLAPDEIREMFYVFDPDGESNISHDNDIPTESLLHDEFQISQAVPSQSQRRDFQISQAVPLQSQRKDVQQQVQVRSRLDQSQSVLSSSLIAGIPKYVSAPPTPTFPQTGTDMTVDDEEDLLLSQIADEIVMAPASTRMHDQQPASKLRKMDNNASRVLNESITAPDSLYLDSSIEDSAMNPTQDQSTSSLFNANASVFTQFPPQKSQANNSEDSGINTLLTFEQVKALSQLNPSSSNQAEAHQEEQEILDCLDL